MSVITYISLCLPLCLFIYLSVCISVYLRVCLYIYLSVCISICLFIYLSQYLSVSLHLSGNKLSSRLICVYTSTEYSPPPLCPLSTWSNSWMTLSFLNFYEGLAPPKRCRWLTYLKVHRTQGQNTALWDFLGHTNPRPPSPTHPVPLTLCSRSRGFLILLIAQDRATTRTNLFPMSFNFYFRLCKKCYETALFLFLAKFKIIRKFCHNELCRGIPTPPPLCGSL